MLRWLLAAVILLGAGPPVLTVAAAHTSVPSAGLASAGTWSFVSAPHLHPVVIDAEGQTDDRRLQRGHFLMADGGALMLDSHLQPVWFNPGPDEDLKAQTLDGKPVLTWWQGAAGGSPGPTLYAVDEHYRVVAKLNAARGWALDMHEAVIAEHDVWVIADRILRHVELAPHGRAARRGTLLDIALQEYDLHSGRLLFNWDALNPGAAPHVPPWTSETPAPHDSGSPWDAYHANSIQLVGSHELLVSMRNTSAAYLVDTRTRRVLWTLGGRHSSFKIPGAARFSFQHDVLLHPGGIVTMFDNRCCAYEGAGRWGPAYAPSRALVLKMSFKAPTVSLLHQYLHQPPLHSDVEGSTQQLANGNVLVGWGSEPFFSEYSSAGKMLLDARLAIGKGSYRVLLTSSWVGKPFYPPSAVVEDSDGARTVYASWNGATEVASWEVLTGSSPGNARTVARKAKSGFETAIPLPDQASTTLRLEALNARGQAIGVRNLTVS